MRIILAAASLVAALSPASTWAAGEQVYMMHGACSEMRIGPKDFTRLCQGKLVSFTTANGRVAFIFALGEVGLLQFSGEGRKQSQMPGERASQPIDKVRLTPGNSASEATATPAAGTCVYGNPFAGTSKVICRVKAGRGLWAATFVTDGEPPQRKGF